MELITNMGKCNGKTVIAMKERGKRIEWKEEVYSSIMMDLPSKDHSRPITSLTKIF